MKRILLALVIALTLTAGGCPEKGKGGCAPGSVRANHGKVYVCQLNDSGQPEWR